AVRDHGRRRDPRRPAGAPGRPGGRDHRGRGGDAGTHRMQRRLRLRAGGDGELGVLRQPDPGVGSGTGRRTAVGTAPGTDPRRTTVQLPADRPDPRRPARSAAGDPKRPRRGDAGRAAGGARARHVGAGAHLMTPLTPVLTRFWDEPEPWSLDTYRRHDGYRALEKALKMAPDEVIALVKESGLRGRGGAGFPTGTKWSFIPQAASTQAGAAGGSDPAARPHYLVVNADESEPGTCKDIPLMLTTPHFLVEGAIIAAYAIRARHAFIYLRGEVVPVLRRLQQAVAEAYEAGYLGADIRGSGFDLDLIVHAGA